LLIADCSCTIGGHSSWQQNYTEWATACRYNVTLESGKFEVIKDSIAHLADDRLLQVLLIVFAFGAFIAGAVGFATPVAVAATMLTRLGFTPLYAAAICLLANAASVSQLHAEAQPDTHLRPSARCLHSPVLGTVDPAHATDGP
jgi:L-lactate permease